MSIERLRVVSVFGTRPEAVKMAPVVQALAAQPEIDSKVVVTAQHRQMLDQVLNLFDIHPDIDLNLMRPDQNLADLTAAILTHLDPVLKDLKPDWVLVQGDTTTVMATALLCYYHKIAVGHVEAGLRTGDKWQPFPEEINRKIAGVIADLHFAPTKVSRQNLLHEGVDDRRIVVTGNPAIDALQQVIQKDEPALVKEIKQKYNIGEGKKQLILVTAHRRENFGAPLENICVALRTIAEKYADRVHLVYPVHLNPNVQEPVYRLLGNVENISLMPPLDYLPMAHLIKSAVLVLTDSGGIQEEATGVRVPTLVLRAVTERPEGVTAGVLKLVGTDPQRIVEVTSRLLDHPTEYQAMEQAPNPFGDGHAAERIVQAILAYKE